jgi:aspartyl-tRNA(Asn)/glutamyl-tRNA(Gln) amidotransferase subunit C
VDIDAAIVAKVAHLARLELTADEVQFFEQKLSQVIHYVEQIENINIVDGGGEQAGSFETPERDDHVLPSLDPAALIALAPKVSGTAFQVPRIIE